MPVNNAHLQAFSPFKEIQGWGKEKDAQFSITVEKKRVTKFED